MHVMQCIMYNGTLINPAVCGHLRSGGELESEGTLILARPGGL